MFVRFVIPCKDEDSGYLTGVFQAAYSLRDRGLLDSLRDQVAAVPFRDTPA